MANQRQTRPRCTGIYQWPRFLHVRNNRNSSPRHTGPERQRI
jgi:hypothetical protein